jgi:hypothetical protein
MWWEEDFPAGSLRGRVTSTPRLGSDVSVSTSVADADAVLSAVREGVEAFLASRPAHG